LPLHAVPARQASVIRALCQLRVTTTRDPTRTSACFTTTGGDGQPLAWW
jgi:hypothetical protein